MGLLDQVLGQVLGGGGQNTGTFGGGTPQAGGLGSLLSGNRGQIAMALISLLASKQMGGSAGGGLGGLFGGGSQTAPGSAQSGGGGLLDSLQGMFGGGAAPQTSGGLGGLLGGGGLTGGALAGGLGDLLSRFAQAGHGDVAQSWVKSGPNAAINPSQLDDVLGSSTVDDLSRQTGLDRGDLLSQLSATLPHVVDQLTPHGRLPTDDEHTNWI